MINKLSEGVDYLASRIKAAKTPLSITGGGNRQDIADSVVPEATILETDSLVGIDEYEPSELYVKVRAGTKVVDLKQELLKNKQELCGDPPGLNNDTVGGVYACGLAGPRKMALGDLRDHVLGCQIIDGKGAVLNFGGKVIKNVAGYDVSRLMVGSFGTLGLITELTLRLRQIPQVDTTITIDCTAHESIQIANEYVAKGLPVVASYWHRGWLNLRLAGSNIVVNKAKLEIGGEEINAAVENVWDPLTNYQFPQFKSAKKIWLCLLPAFAELPFDDHGLIECYGTRRWFFDDAPADIRKIVTEVGGSTIYFRRPDEEKEVPVFTKPDAVTLAIQKNIKAAFDPKNIFNPGRFSYL